MSEIRATTISDAAGTGPITLTGQSATKAWVNYNGTGTVAIRDSFNVSSLVDTGTGFWTVNYSNNMSDSNNSVTTGANQNSPYPIAFLYAQGINAAYVNLNYAQQGSADYDSSYCAAHTMGDLA